MNRIIVLSSVTYALKSQDLLKKESIYASLTRSPAVKAVKGCGYGLLLPAVHEERAKKILQNAGVRILGTVNE